MTCDKFSAPDPVLETPGTLGVAGTAVMVDSRTSLASDIVRSNYKSYLQVWLVEGYPLHVTLLRYHCDKISLQVCSG